jgi:acyl carrier protein
MNGLAVGRTGGSNYNANKSMLEKLQKAFREGLALGDTVNYEDLAYGRTEGWDSVAHMGLVAMIESELDVMLSTDDVIDLSSFVKAQEILSAKHGISFAV